MGGSKNPQPETADDCGWCYRCDERKREGLPFPQDIMRRFPLCSECGNKRCPKATHHDNECSGSNERGQHGSVYS